MPALYPIDPITLKEILIKYAYDVADEDEHNWVLVRGQDEVPLTLPKHGKLVALDIMHNALHEAKMDNGTYWRLLAEVQGGTSKVKVEEPD